MLKKQYQVKFYCEVCGNHTPVEIEHLKKDDLNGDMIWGDIVCTECHFVIATISSNIAGNYSFVLETTVNESS